MNLISVKEAAQFLQVSTRTVYKWLDNDALPGAKKIEGVWRIDLDKLAKWIANVEFGSGK